MMKWKQGAGAVVLAAMALGAFAPSAFAYENPNGGQHFDRGRFPRTYHVAENGPKVTCPGPECTQEFINDAVQRRVMTPKEAQQIRKLQSKPQTPTADRGIKDNGIKSCGSCGLTSGRTAAPKPKSGTIYAVVGGIAGLGAILAVSGGNGKPSSP